MSTAPAAVATVLLVMVIAWPALAFMVRWLLR
jgi:hypothetical protein